MDTLVTQTLLKHWGQFVGGFDPVPGGSVTFCLHHEIGILKIQTEILKTLLSLFPLDNSIAAVVEDYDNEVQAQTSGCFQLL